MKNKITGLLLIGVLLAAVYIFYLWFNLPEYDYIAIETKLLVAASCLCVLGLLTVYYFQSKGYLNNRIIHISTLLFAITFLIGASFLGYASYNSYVKRTTTLEALDIIEIPTFNNEESQVYIGLKESRNKLLGYDFFLKETAQEYEPSNYSYANVLKRELIQQLANKAGTQTYWDDILNNVYVLDTLTQTYKRSGYEIMYVFGNKEYPNEDLKNTTDKDLIYNTSVREYWQTQILNSDRKPENIVSFWRNNKVFLYTFFSKSQYDRLCKQVIDDLIAIKQRINKQPNYQEFYTNYDISDPEFLSFPDPKFVKSYEYSWPFSFWDRRFEEENDTVIYEILVEIQKHYKN